LHEIYSEHETRSGLEKVRPTSSEYGGNCYPKGRDEPARCAQHINPVRIADRPGCRTKKLSAVLIWTNHIENDRSAASPVAQRRPRSYLRTSPAS
jgi:hypothetical protein